MASGEGHTLLSSLAAGVQTWPTFTQGGSAQRSALSSRWAGNLSSAVSIKLSREMLPPPPMEIRRSAENGEPLHPSGTAQPEARDVAARPQPDVLVRRAEREEIRHDLLKAGVALVDLWRDRLGAAGRECDGEVLLKVARLEHWVLPSRNGLPHRLGHVVEQVEYPDGPRRWRQWQRP